MQWFQTTYTVRFNRRHKLCGHVFQGRYKSLIVDATDAGYFATLGDYIHLNPVRARIIGPDDRLVDFPWSSYPAYVTGRNRPRWLRVDRVLGESGVEDNAAGRRHFAERMRERAVHTLSGADDIELARLRRSWCLGRESFRERMLGLLNGNMDAAMVPPDQRRTFHDEDQAGRLILAGLKHFQITPEELPDLPNGDPRKLAVAAMVRANTSVSNGWLAARLALGHASRVSRVDAGSAIVVKLAQELTEKLEYND